MPTGEYTLTWLEAEDWFTPESNPAIQTLAADDTVTFAGTYLTPRVEIGGIVDVPADQGRFVRMTWERSHFDAPDDDVDVIGYGVYRRQDAYKGLARRAAGEPDGDGPQRLEGWDFLTTVPAHGDSLYQYVASTLCDSTITDGMCWSVFFLRTMTPDPFVYWDSPPDSGYSLDNLVPGVPTGLTVAYAGGGNAVDWDINPDPDVRLYNVYRSALPGCPFPGGEPTAQVAGPGWFDDLSGADGDAWDYCYFVTAVDFAGNEGEPSAWDGAEATGLTDLPAPTRLALLRCSPNPFNPRTRIRFDLPRPGRVDLAVYDMSGRLVRRMISRETRPAGRHGVTWYGRDEHGRRVASGMYFCRLQTADGVRIRRVAMVK